MTRSDSWEGGNYKELVVERKEQWPKEMSIVWVCMFRLTAHGSGRRANQKAMFEEEIFIHTSNSINQGTCPTRE